ncbi:hypothetical protein BBK14_11265 [Parafrankia soli]|uniref:Phage gp6-like head-tail connector protein n=1 Tax=Parafrankia soli TaxID=2599596 RepID=A0A1S1R5H7_9ACTN|nr:hypothetical protein [Parafrankia soli]OHV42193.1 hypothetical protein BBK14_11265 [Parafrankia soli]
MAALVSYAELTARPGFDGLDEAEAEALLDDASALVRLEARGLLDDVVSPDTPGAVRVVVIQMARRGWSNPAGYQQESLGDHSYTAGVSGSSGVATLYLTAREKKIIRRAVGVLGVGTAQLEGYLPETDDRGGLLDYETEFLGSL